MRKFLAILCTAALITGISAPVGPVMAATSDPYEFDGDIVENPWGEIFETEAPTEEPTEAPTEEPTSKEEATTVAKEFAIVSQPSDVEVEPGENAVFTVGATGNGLTYQWYVAGPTATSWTKLSGAVSRKATFSIGVIEAYKNWRYRCVVKDETGKTLTSNEAKIIMVARTPLEVIEQPQDVIIEGTATQAVTFSTNVKGVGLTYQWQYYEPTAGTWIKLAGASARTNTITMNVNSAFDGYRYRCFVKDCVDNAVETATATLYVKRDLAITSQPAQAVVASGDTAVFTVGATGTGITYQWQYQTKNGTTWNTISGSQARAKSFSTAVNSAFNGYKYRCVITDYYGNVLNSEPSVVTIVTGTTINSQPQSVTVASGSKVSFSVDATGPSLTYQWQYQTKNGTTWTNLSGATSSTFSTTVNTAFNGFKYRCVLTDSLGNVINTDAAVVTVQ